MVEKAKRQRKGTTICEEDVTTLLQRYRATTVLALLQEVAQVQDVKIDWNDLVKKTSTGISNAREYQMLWRHLAYRHALAERLDDGAEPMDDDSDLDYELEAIPPVSSEASTEAAAYVKVMIASGLQSDAIRQNGATVQAPLTINIPNGKPSSRASSENSQLQGTNITVPVSVQKQPLPLVASAEVLDANGSASGNQPTRKKRILWTEAEDLELIAAVQKCGEGNWAILKGDFKGDRTASQLSKRWAIIRKKQGNLNVGGSSQLSDDQLATRHAVSLALNMPMVDNLTTACSTGTGDSLCI
ncbi:Telomeric repeat-binding factor like [Actinidia chinensis var. chinensis]|uniref:Telomeric repeat-binding factor like n=1 Tax=Actinidia chinensis var. chinensis TaxID=1590841 RepID=A0A2R6NWU8_ACTCC|nr:Telomeric repeat-binding factor like [Actinidia chinensis var. chinensis]